MATEGAAAPQPQKYTKRLLPQSICSEARHGPINKAQRSAGERAALDKRRGELLQSMTREKIEAAYSGQAVRVNEHLARKQRRNDEIDAQLAQLRDEHDMEMRVIRASLVRRDEKQTTSASSSGTGEKLEEEQKQQPDAAAATAGPKDVTAAPGLPDSKDAIKTDEHEEGEIGTGN